MGHVITWIVCLALALVANHYLQRWMARDDDEAEPDDAAPPVVVPVAPLPTVTDRPWPRSVWSRRGPRL